MRYWTPLYSSLREHRKVYALAEALKIPRAHAIGLVVCLWTWALDNAVDGDLSAFPEQAIADACGWSKKAGALIAGLERCGWLDGRYIHEWDEYAGSVADQEARKRELNRERQAKRRSKRKGGAAGHWAAEDGQGEAPGQAGQLGGRARVDEGQDDQNGQNGLAGGGGCHADVTRDTGGDVTQENGGRHALPCIYTTTSTTTPTTTCLEGENTAAIRGRAREAHCLEWYRQIAGEDDPRWRLVVAEDMRGGKYTAAQVGCALEYAEKRMEQRVLKHPFEYLIRLLEDWRARGLRTREAIEAARDGYADGDIGER